MEIEKEGKMEKKEQTSMVDWLKSDAAQRILEESMKEACDRTARIGNCMRVNQDSLLQPVTL